MRFLEAFHKGLAYDAFLAQYGTDEYRRRWRHVHDAVHLSPDQVALLASFKRHMPVLCLAGAWCGDCVFQCPILEHFAQASPRIELKFVDRDADPALREALSICGGARVPVVVFLNEEGEEVGRYGDRTLATYRKMAAELLGATCPTGLVVPEPSHLGAVTQEWLNEFERVQLLLRLSPRLRQKHGD